MNKNFKKIVFKTEAVSNLNNNQMNVVIGGRGLTDVYELCWGATNVGACSQRCGEFTEMGNFCNGFTVSSGTSICYDLCY